MIVVGGNRKEVAMSTNLVSSVTQVITPNLISRIASGFGLDSSQIEKVVQAGIPAILAALATLVSKPGGASALTSAIAQQQPGALSTLSKAVGSSAERGFIENGISSLNSLLGGATASSLANALGQYTGIGGNASKSMMGLLTPAVLGVLGQEQRAKGLDISGLANLLESQKENIASALPGGFSKYLTGTGILNGVASDTTSYSTQKPPTQLQASSSLWSWVLSALAVLVLLGIAWNLLPESSSKKTVVTTATDNSQVSVDTMSRSTSPSSTGTSVGTSGSDVMPAPFQALDNLRGIKAGDVDLGAQLASAVNNMRTSLSSIQDTSSAQAAVQPLANSAGEFSKINKLLGQLSPEARKTVANAIAATKPALDQLFDKALAIPGVSALIKPTVDSIRSELNTLTTA
jgi:hypothetical protein